MPLLATFDGDNVSAWVPPYWNGEGSLEPATLHRSCVEANGAIRAQIAQDASEAMPGSAMLVRTPDTQSRGTNIRVGHMHQECDMILIPHGEQSRHY